MSFVESRYASEEEVAKDALVSMDWPVTWQAKVVPYALIGGMTLAWLAYVLLAADFDHEGLAMLKWAVSSAALRQGRYETLVTHMFAHGGPAHLFMNMSALFSLGPAVISKMGGSTRGSLLFLALFLLSGFAGVLTFLVIHPNGEVPMLGASGAIFGVLGLAARFDPAGDGYVALKSPRTWAIMKGVVQTNVVLVLFLTIPALLAGRGGGVAWESHLGGFLFGLLAAP